MTRSTKILLAILVIVAIMFAGTSTVSVQINFGSKPVVEPELIETFDSDAPMSQLQHRNEDSYEVPDAAIWWRTETRTGASPLGILRAVQSRMEYEQATPLGSDQTAQAMVAVLEAIAILSGKESKAEDGTPIIQ